jgi:hypothetical protein
MLQKIFIRISLLCTIIVGSAYSSDENPSCIDWGYSSYAEPSHLLLYASGDFAYILFSPFQEQSKSLQDMQWLLHNYFKPHIPHIKNTVDLIHIWQAIEHYLHKNAPEMHLAIASFSGTKLLAILRGDCSLYHVKNAKCTTPVNAETIKTIHQQRSNPKNEFVSLCGIQEWNQGDKLFMHTPNMERRICPETICTNFIKKHNHASASRLSYLLILHAFAPQMPLETQDQCDAAAKQSEKGSACIVIKKIV